MINEEILNSFKITASNYYANSNSLHKLGLESKRLENASSKQILNILSLQEDKWEVVYTKSAKEANTLAILGIFNKYKNKDKTIIVLENISDNLKNIITSLEENDFNIKKLKEEEITNNLNNLGVFSFLCAGSNTDFKLISQIKQNNPNSYILIDAQINLNLTNNYKDIDMLTFDAKTINAITGIGCLIKKKQIILEPLLHGGKSTTNYRSGTPSLPFIVSLSKALKIYQKTYENK